jgi:L-malate glycosyltransferase
MTHVTYIGNFLSQHGYNPTYSEALAAVLSREGLAVRTASGCLNPLVRLGDMALAVLRTRKRESCVIVDLCSGPRAYPAACVIATLSRLARRPYVVVLHGGNLPNLSKRARAWLPTILRSAASVVSPSMYLADHFATDFDVEVIPNALSIMDYPYRCRAAPSPRFLYLRAFHERYGPFTALRAFALVKQQLGKGRLVMAGPELDHSLTRCKELSKEMGIEKDVEFLGRVPKDRIPSLGSDCDIFLNPTYVDNTPVSTIEAMAMGMCIVATTSGGLPHLLRDGETALLVSPGDERAMANAIMKVLADSQLAARLSASARRAAEGMDWSEVVPKWLRLIQSVAR